MKPISLCLALLVFVASILGTSMSMSLAFDGSAAVSESVSFDHAEHVTKKDEMLSSECCKSGTTPKKGACQIDLTALPAQDAVLQSWTKSSGQSASEQVTTTWPSSAPFKPPRLI